MYTCKIGLKKSLCVYVCAVLEGMYTCKTGNFGKETFSILENETFCLCLCCCIGYVHTSD